ncbi:MULTISPECIES: hypothetical protein [unclassified Polaromonas]|jgi:hypothetical protein|uniref:hypothetical protein n=1 Tax=unclassified Polaromonas TaxID=2638319 RepID=UPI000BD9A02A|nr:MULTISPECIES: hypothetical protein [unclassified Polaromonas]OYY35044.1 MAG: hypothetical protein B7Y60_14315 [Polaromonas sp. 35-63-35]OYZ20184.1 MAG: hypothetical protein B7Y28_09685 [Polaromonas sp. 16-63-31]OYZ77939.1 MAG: hypothetical protein B7Y09_14510 [Polaromonas sp. 24-63-21]OZA49449.1 MAG: hypothetical protein B7X88_13525 [Polaromonas sp. 17-63-33]OZA87418.1 MAG: hypothetical protein B7X65_12945 [Polaromonas sp. 39-63-25]
MPHSVSLISTIAARMKLPSLVDEAEAKRLQSENAGKIFLGEEELALSMMRYVLERSALAQRHT